MFLGSCVTYTALNSEQKRAHAAEEVWLPFLKSSLLHSVWYMYMCVVGQCSISLLTYHLHPLTGGWGHWWFSGWSIQLQCERPWTQTPLAATQRRFFPKVSGFLSIGEGFKVGIRCLLPNPAPAETWRRGGRKGGGERQEGRGCCGDNLTISTVDESLPPVYTFIKSWVV